MRIIVDDIVYAPCSVVRVSVRLTSLVFFPLRPAQATPSFELYTTEDWELLQKAQVSQESTGGRPVQKQLQIKSYLLVMAIEVSLRAREYNKYGKVNRQIQRQADIALCACTL